LSQISSLCGDAGAQFLKKPILKEPFRAINKFGLVTGAFHQVNNGIFYARGQQGATRGWQKMVDGA